MTEREFNSITPRSFQNKLVGFSKNEEIKAKTNWEQARFIAYASVLPYAGKKVKTADKVFPFPWDKETSPEVKEDPKTAAEKLKNFWDKIDGKEVK